MLTSLLPTSGSLRPVGDYTRTEHFLAISETMSSSKDDRLEGWLTDCEEARAFSSLMVEDDHLKFHAEFSTDEFGYRSAGGDSWKKCSQSSCLGEAVVDGLCFGHLSTKERHKYITDVHEKPRALSLRGVDIDESCIGDFKSAMEELSRHVAPPVSFSNAKISCPAEFTDLKFIGLDLSRVSAKHPLSFRRCDFEQLVNLSYARAAHVTFSHSSIRNGMFLVGAKGHLTFQNGSLGGSLDLECSRVALYIADSTCAGSLNLNHTRARSFSASRVKFGGDISAHCAKFESSSLMNATFQSYAAVELPESQRNSGLVDATFEASASLRLCAETIQLVRVRFQQGGYVAIRRGDLILDDLQVGRAVHIAGEGCRPRVQSMDGAHVQGLRLNNIDLSRCALHKVHGLEDVTLENSVVFASAPTRWPLFSTPRRCVHDEVVFRARRDGVNQGLWTKLLNGQQEQSTPSTQDRLERDASACLGVYRALRRAAERNSDRDLADEFYFGEMEMQRLSRESSAWTKLLLWVYWVISGYGLRLGRSLISLMVLFFLSAGFYALWGLEAKAPLKTPNFRDGMLFAARSMVPGIAPNQPVNMAGSAMEVVLAIVGPVLFTLTGLAVRNRVRRLKGG